MKKTSYWDIIIYTIIIFGILYAYKIKMISYGLMEIFLVIALAVFALYNLRNQIKKILNKNKNKS